MGFSYRTGQTTAGAADEVLDWFYTFEAWISQILIWEIISGSGTKNLVIRSLGEAGAYTMLYIHVWESAPGSVRIEVQNDAVGTQATNEGGILLTGGAQFTYFMAANQEAIAIVFKTAIPNWTQLYAGCVMPFAMTPTDETYTMIATDDTLNACSVLRNHDGTWDVDIVLTDNPLGDNIELCGLDNSFTPGGILAGAADGIVGQLWHVSGEVGQNATSGLLLEDTLTTQASSNTTTDWIVLRGSTVLWFCMRSGGSLPVGLRHSTNYRYSTGIATSYTDFIVNKLTPFMEALGWINLGDPGLHDIGRLFYSAGETGLDDIFIIVAYSLPLASYFANYVQDDAAGTHRTANLVNLGCDALAFPTRYHLAGDRDCLLYTIEVAPNDSWPVWLGKVIPGNPNAPTTAYNLVVGETSANPMVLRDHNGNWTPGAGGSFFYKDVVALSSPNLFDGLTTILWPMGCVGVGAGGGVRRDFHGVLKYLYQVNGYGACPGDTFPVADRTYRAMRPSWAIRIS